MTYLQKMGFDQQEADISVHNSTVFLSLARTGVTIEDMWTATLKAINDIMTNGSVFMEEKVQCMQVISGADLPSHLIWHS